MNQRLALAGALTAAARSAAMLPEPWYQRMAQRLSLEARIARGDPSAVVALAESVCAQYDAQEAELARAYQAAEWEAEDAVLRQELERNLLRRWTGELSRGTVPGWAKESVMHAEK